MSSFSFGSTGALKALLPWLNGDDVPPQDVNEFLTRFVEYPSAPHDAVLDPFPRHEGRPREPLPLSRGQLTRLRHELRELLDYVSPALPLPEPPQVAKQFRLPSLRFLVHAWKKPISKWSQIPTDRRPGQHGQFVALIVRGSFADLVVCPDAQNAGSLGTCRDRSLPRARPRHGHRIVRPVFR